MFNSSPIKNVICHPFPQPYDTANVIGILALALGKRIREGTGGEKKESVKHTHTPLGFFSESCPFTHHPTAVER